MSIVVPLLSPRNRPGELFALWRHRMERRRSLAGVSARDLIDAGISPTQAAFETEQPFWRSLSVLRGD